MQGLIVDVYRSGRRGMAVDCTNGGLSGQYDELTLIGEGVSGPFEPIEDKRPAFILVSGPFGSTRAVMADAETGKEIKVDGELGPMFGGNFIYSSDSRFPNDQPVKVFDRFESQELYDVLST